MLRKSVPVVMCALTLLTASCTCIAKSPAPSEAKRAKQAENPVKLRLPSKLYAVPGVETNLYFDNVSCVINPDNYAFHVKCAKGRGDQKRWRFTPVAGDVGTYPLTLQVWGDSGVVAEAATELVVSPADAGKGKNLTILVVGDSLTNATVYPQQLLDLTKKSGSPSLTMIGSHAGSGRAVQPGGVAHEGYGGWTWRAFVDRWTDDSKLTDPVRKLYAKSKFLREKNGNGVLDFQHYLDRMNQGKAPDVITVQLGVNDIFAATDENVDAKIQEIFKYMDILLTEFRKVAPNALIGVGLTTPGARSQDAFGENYKSQYYRWQYKKNQQRLVNATLDKLAASNPYKVSIIPSHVNLDCENNYPARSDAVNVGNPAKIVRQSNGVHPAPAGYKQIGDTFYCWLKAEMNKK